MSDELIKENESVEEQPAEEAKPYNVVIEDARKDLYKAYASSRRLSNILMIIVVVAIVGIMFLIISNNQIMKICGYCAAGALVIGMIVYYVLNRKLYRQNHKVKQVHGYVHHNEQHLEGCELDSLLLVPQVGKQYGLEGVYRNR